MAVVSNAVWGVARSLAPDRERATVAILSAIVVLAWPGALGQVLVIALAGLIGWRLLGSSSSEKRASLPPAIGRRFSKEMQMRKVVGAVVVAVGFVFAHSVWLAQNVPVTSAADEGTEVAKLKGEIEELKRRLPSQSHAMMDVDYHFANLWFAAQSRNWPLAQFYLNETRSHLRWAVRIIPVRRIPSGEVDLRGLLEAVDATGLADVGKAITEKNTEAFGGAYRRTLEGC